MPTETSTLDFIVFSSFVLTLIGMAAASLFFFVERTAVPTRYRSLMTVSGVILFIAAANYWYMTNYFAALAAGSGDEDMITLYRYVDWVLTTPLMLLKFPLLLGLGPRGRAFMIRLIVLDLAMIFLGFFGELQSGQNTTLHLGLFGAGFVCWLLIFASLFKAMSALPPSVPDSVRKGVRFMFFFVLIGWSIYPIGYIMPSLGFGLEVKHLIYNIGDLVNKVGLALVVYLAITAADTREEPAD